MRKLLALYDKPTVINLLCFETMGQEIIAQIWLFLTDTRFVFMNVNLTNTPTKLLISTEPEVLFEHSWHLNTHISRYWEKRWVFNVPGSQTINFRPKILNRHKLGVSHWMTHHAGHWKIVDYHKMMSRYFYRLVLGFFSL